MNDDIKHTLEQLEEAIQDSHNIKKLSNMAGELFAAFLCYDLPRIEKRLVTASANPRVNEMLSSADKESLYDKIALLGCLDRFMHDLLDNTNVAKDCKARYDAMIEAQGKPLS